MSLDNIRRWNPAEPGQTPVLCAESVVAIGIFDGVHIGHRSLLADAHADARDRDVPLVVVTFERDPEEVFCPQEGLRRKLLGNGERLDMIAQVVPCTVVALPATREVFGLGPETFLEALWALCHPAAVHVGADFRFGARNAGTVVDVERWGGVRGVSCHPHALVAYEGEPVSASRIRSLLDDGDVELARALLGGRPHCIEGRVVHGRGEGAGMGFATANLELEADAGMPPADGVYAAIAVVGREGQRFPAAVNMGTAPSFETATAQVEAHLVGYEGNLYGAHIQLRFLARLRDSRKFDSMPELISCVEHDIEQVREIAGGDLHA